MKIKLVMAGKTEEAWLEEGIGIYTKKMFRYIPFEMIYLPTIKNRKNIPIPEQKSREGVLLLQRITSNDALVLLDERGKFINSVQFSLFLQKEMNRAVKNLVFAVGGPYGFSEDVYRRAQNLLSLSQMTFSHQMVRLIFMEQLYRAFTIMRNEPYHHS